MVSCLSPKEVIYDGLGKPKGNCDADLVLQATKDYFDKALIVSSDGDYASLVRFLHEQNKLLGLLSPAPKEKCSILLKRINAKIYYIKDKRSILKARNKKAPNMNETTSGSFS